MRWRRKWRYRSRHGGPTTILHTTSVTFLHTSDLLFTISDLPNVANVVRRYHSCSLHHLEVLVNARPPFMKVHGEEVDETAALKALSAEFCSQPKLSFTFYE